MSKSLNESIEHLRQLNLRIRQQLEVAEARVPEINRLLEQFVATKFLNQTAFVGGVILSRSYSAVSGRADSDQVLVAGLLIPGGIGAIQYDSEELAMLDNYPDNEGKKAFLNFVPFDQCESAASWVWQELLSNSDKRRLGGKVTAAYSLYGGTIGMWAELHKCSWPMAIIDILHQRGSLSGPRYERMWRDVGGADPRADTAAMMEKNAPLNDDIVALYRKLLREESSGKSKVQLAIDFRDGDRKQAASLLRGVRRYQARLRNEQPG